MPGPDTSKSRVLFADQTTYRLDIPSTGEAGAWQATATGRQLGFQLGGTGVLYRPDRILIAGGANTSETEVSDSWVTLDASNPDNSLWQPTGSLALKRSNHNLVLLPNGKVMAVGGVNSLSEVATSPAVKRPEIWDPDANAGVGSWSGSTTLAEQATIKNYHSTAILLPDGRVLSAGGENHQDKYYGEIFCPPYLFDSTGTLAVRPAATGAPLVLSVRDTVTVCVSDTAHISRAALLRPGAPTHSFDQNQRYVPLSFVKTGSPSRLFVTTPAGSDRVPPGDYLLFLTGSAGGPDVPSVARWVRVAATPGLDTCDSVWPGTISDLGPDLVSNCSIWLTWTETGDDTTLAASGRVSSNDLRRWTGPINSESAWQQATRLSEAGPVLAGTSQGHQDSGLQPCTNYHYALRVTDDNNHLSAIHSEVKIKTLCGSGCGGSGPQGATGEVVSGETSARRETLSPAQASAPSPAALTVESEPLEGGAWRVVVRSHLGFEGADANHVLLQAKDAGGSWETKGRIAPGASDNVLGVCAPRSAGRRIFPGRFEVREIAASLRSASGALALGTAEHSGAGDLAAAVRGGEGAVSLVPGQTLELVYEPGDSTVAPSEDWLVLLQRNDETSPAHDGIADGLDLPKQFALYQNQPNPFRGTTTIRFDLPKPSPVRLTIYDIAGRKVRTLTRSNWPAGRHSLKWDHRSDAGVQLGAGAYIYRLTADEFRSEKKMILLAR